MLVGMVLSKFMEKVRDSTELKEFVLQVADS